MHHRFLCGIISIFLSSHALSETIPIEMVGRKSYISVKIGKNKRKLMLDTGATSNNICSTKMEGAKFKKVGAVEYAGAHRIWKRADIHEVDSISMGSKKFANVRFIAYPPSDCHGDGIVGISTLKKAGIVHFDYKKKELTLGSKKELKKYVKFKPLEDSRVVFDVKIDGKEYPGFLFDTGASFGGIRPELFNSIEAKTGKTLHVTGVGGGVEKTPLKIIKKFCIDEFCSSNVEIPAAKWVANEKEWKRNGVFGQSFFKDKVFAIDFEKNRLWYQ